MVSDLLKSRDVTPDIHLTLWDDYAVMSMVEKGLGISILPEQSAFQECGCIGVNVSSLSNQ